MNAVWFVSLDSPGSRAEWDVASLGPPDPAQLVSVRRPNSGAFSRHVPASAYSVTTGTHLELESGLEHELVRTLDRQRDVVHLVAQPLWLHFPTEPGRAPSHQPDLLSVRADGSVTVWDVRPAERRDELFDRRARLTAEACHEARWGYETFAGLTETARMNLLWLSGFKLSMPWHRGRRDELSVLFRIGDVRVADVVSADGGHGELVSTMWHLLWSGALACDLDRRITRGTTLSEGDL